MARRKVKATLDDFARAVVIVYEALNRAQEVCDWAPQARLFETAQALRDVSVKVVPAAKVHTP